MPTARSDDQLPFQQLLGASLHAELLLRGQTLATAESMTGGALADLLSASPGAGETYLGGVVAYTTRLKLETLSVRQATVDEHGVVSARCAAEMATGVRDLVAADWGIATTGVAGPASQEDKPIGLTYLGLAGPDAVETLELHLEGDRATIRAEACDRAVLLALARMVLGGTRQPDR